MEDDSRTACLFRKLLFSIVVLSGTAMLFACQNDIKTIQAVTGLDSIPTESGTNVTIWYSESGKVVAQLKAPTLNHYTLENPYLEMPDGIEIIFFDSLKEEDSRLTAEYARHMEKAGIMEARRDVVVVNTKNDTIRSEEMIWNQKAGRVYSNVQVHIVTNNGDEDVFGSGFESDETFENWVIKKPVGEFYVEEESDSTATP
jgi:LPS export ABC transporter protein LptC